MALTTVAPKIVQKISDVPGQVPTLGPSFDYTDGTWSATDIYEGELFMNIADKTMYTFMDGVLVDLTPIIPAVFALEDVLANGNNTGTNDIEIDTDQFIKYVTQPSLQVGFDDLTVITKKFVDDSIAAIPAGPTPGLDDVLAVDNATGANWIEVESGYGLQGTDGGSITDSISVDPLGLGNGTGILSQDFLTGRYSGIGVSPNGGGMSSTDGSTIQSKMTLHNDFIGITTNDFTSSIIDGIYIDPRMLTYGTGIKSEDTLTGRYSSIGVSPNGIDTNLAGASTGVIGGTVTTSNATPTVITSFVPQIEKVYHIEAIITGIKTDSTKGITIKIPASFRVNGSGVVTAFGTSTAVIQSEFSTATATLTTDGTNILVTVTGEVATTINWTSTITSNY